jgi:NADH dehydrogenase/NADH:ubiquinone oxidoreductase subunit G
MVKLWAAGFVDTLDGEHFRNWMNAGDLASPALSEESSWKKVADADFILVVGCDAFKNHPMLASLLRQAYMGKGVAVAILGRNPCASADNELCLDVEADELPGLIGALAHMTDDAHPSPAGVKIAADRLEALARITRLYKAARSPWVVVGEQVTAVRQEGQITALLQFLRAAAAGPAVGGLLTLLKPATNSAAAWRLGLASRRPRDGHPQGGLVLLEAEQDQATSRLPACGFLVVVTPYISPQMAEQARVLLPKTLWMQEDGTYAGLDGREEIFKPGVLPPPDGVRSGWQILLDLGRLSGHATLPASWAEVRRQGASALAAVTDAAMH